MSRLEKLKKKIDELYQSKNVDRDEWADWMREHHVFIVADYAGALADRFHANKELAQAAGMLHDIADAVMGRFVPGHKEQSLAMAKKFLLECMYSDEEISIIVDDAMQLHSCRDGNIPRSLEGKIMATADGLVHLKTDFYQHAIQFKQKEKTNEEIKKWALPKIDRDFSDKILFTEVQEETRPDYERLKQLISSELG